MMKKQDEVFSQNVINDEIEQRIQLMEGKDYTFPERIKKADFICLFGIMLLCLICVVILKIYCYTV